MSWRHALLVLDLGDDAHAAFEALRQVSPQVRRLTVLALVPAERFAWLSDDAPADLSGPMKAAFDALGRAAASVASEVVVELATDLDGQALGGLLAESPVDLVVARRRSLRRIAQVAELRKRHAVAVLWLPAVLARADDAPAGQGRICVWGEPRGGGAIAAFLRDHAGHAQHVDVLLTSARMPVDPATAAAAAVSGVRDDLCYVEPARGQSPRQWLQARADAGLIDLLVFARLPVGMLLEARWPVPILVLSPAAPVVQDRALVAADAVADLSGSRIRLEYAGSIGRRTPIPDQDLGLVSDGRAVARVAVHNGQARLPDDACGEAFGLFRFAEADAPVDPLAAVEHWISILRPGGTPLVLCDAEVVVRDAHALRRIPTGFAPLAVRLQPTRGFDFIRARLRAAGLGTRVVDAGAVLDEGEAFDVSGMLDAVRLARVAARLRIAGFAVAAIVHRSPIRPAANGFAELHVDEIGRHRWQAAARAAAAGLGDRLDALGAPSLPGNRVEIELDNALARRWLLDAIAGSRRCVHVQVYMAADDDVGRQLELALADAAARGVVVRLLVDSLHGLHGSLGARNPLLERLGALPGVDVRVSRPVTGLPSVQDIKQRDHRKLAVVDGVVALVGGRNIAHEYYTGFDEVALAPDSPWRLVPWLDAGARVRGPAVAAIERLFLDAWTRAGGAGFAVQVPPAAGTTPLRVVAHDGLRDAHTLEAYLALIDTARERVDVINGFPLILEIQHALLRALERGVRVRTLFGHLTPTHAGGPFEGPWAAARTAATALVHSRMDALIAAGAEGHQFSVRPYPGWTAGLGAVRSHVHAKLMSVDGRVCAVGSANMDITAGYWENELMLVVEDAACVGALEARIAALFADSVRIDRDDPQWRALAGRREWMRYWPGVLSV
ncbi:phosphatidylserine/phosphatidylglycerophosphate/cardiolipin synthase family protein [Luteimonas sp. XNQY3]|nr:phosphatidylserine/phosphatidylglycerophosphate/cardiolipin synthase family protein [Luteimonas sp. XNQY3]MCD9007032.1 phosphatidylserine/phosphatidylglycerophosphate/cardiolipin synthase family protein [Luteimonas sp. XNQY3]